ncbi:MAG: YtxH domain-containing protein [Flavobacteriales bacterium]
MSTQKTLIALVAGTALGAVAGIMLAPASGEKTRKKMMKKASGLRDQLTDLMGQGESMVNEAKDTAKKASAQASKAVNHTMDEAKSSFEHAKNATVKG